MSQKPSLKKAKLAVKKAVRTLTKDEYSELHTMVILPFEQAVDNKRNNDELFSKKSPEKFEKMYTTKKTDLGSNI